MNVLWLIIIAMVFCVGQGIVFRFFNLRRLTYTRFFSKRIVHEGEQVELIEIIRNNKPLPVPWVRAESRISPYLSFNREKAEDYNVSGGRYHKSVFFLGAFKQIRRRHTVTCLHRGEYQLKSVALTAGDLFGAGLSTRQLDIECPLTVYPRLLGEEELPQPANRWQGEVTVKRWIQPDPFLLSGIREYRPGDMMRDVHWRQTARTGQMQVKTHDYTSEARLMVVLNVQLRPDQWADLNPKEEESIEQAIRIAATLCVRALKNGADAGFVTNGCLPEDKDSGNLLYIPSKGGADQEDAILNAMARMLLHREVTAVRMMDALNTLHNEDILFLTYYTDEIIENGLEQLRAHGNTVSVFVPERK